jgi:hypothetical protein
VTLRYFVVWPDGQRFGPADEKLLTLWAAERRIGAGTLLEEEGTRRVVPATQLPSLQALFGMGAGPSASPTWQSSFPAAKKSSVEVTWAWGLALLAIVCFPLHYVLAILATVLSCVAITKRQPTAIAALIFSIAVLVLPTLFAVFLGMPGLSFP